MLLLDSLVFGAWPRRAALLRNSGGELYFFQKAVSLGGEFAQRMLEIGIAEPRAAHLKALDRGAAPVAGRLLRIRTDDGADRVTVLKAQAGRLSLRTIAIGQAFRRLGTHAISFESAILLDGLADVHRRGRERGSNAILLVTFVVDLGRLNARYEEVVGEGR